MAVLGQYVAVGAQEFAKNVGTEAYEKAKGMLATLKTRWAGDEEAAHALNKFEEKPERYAPVLEDILREKLAQDEELASQLALLLRAMGPDLKVVQRMEKARRVTGVEAERVTGGRTTVDQEIGEGEDVTGARIHHLGPVSPVPTRMPLTSGHTRRRIAGFLREPRAWTATRPG